MIRLQKQRALKGSFNPTIGELYKDKEILAANPFMGELYSTFANAAARPATVTGARYNQVSNAFWNSVHEVLSGKAKADAALQQLGRQRSVGVWLPSAIAVPAVVGRTDFLATIPEGIARRLAPLLGLQTLPPPLPLEEVRVGMYWHDRMHQNPPHKWLRQVVREVAGELAAERPLPLGD